jgi:hypothetical protein
MGDKDRVYIFHVYRKDGTALLLHPFCTPEKIVGQLERSSVEGRYGMEPRVEALTMLRNELYRLIEAGVKGWLSDVRFIPKFLVTALVFVLVYFFLSYVVRDPLPVIDEVAGALAAAVVVFVLQGRRDLGSKMATQKRLQLRVLVDRITFRESEFVKLVEGALHRSETEGIEQVIREIVQPAQQEFGERFQAEAGQFVAMLEKRFDFRKLQREEKLFKRILSTSSREQNRSLDRLAESKKYDFPLYAVYKSFKKTISNRA